MLFDRGPQVALAFFIFLLVAGLLRVIFGFWSVARQARDEWQVFARLQPNRAAMTSETAFRKAFIKAYGPHGMAVAIAAILVAAAITPLAMIGLTYVYHKFVIIPDGAQLPPAKNIAEEFRRQLRRDGPIVRAFFLFFGLLGSWSVVAYFLASFYHNWVGEGKDRQLRAIYGLDGSELHGDGSLPAYKKGMMHAPKRKRPSWSPLVQNEGGELVLPDNHTSQIDEKEG